MGGFVHLKTSPLFYKSHYILLVNTIINIVKQVCVALTLISLNLQWSLSPDSLRQMFYHFVMQ